MKKFVFTALSAALMLIGSNAFAQLSVNAGFTNSALKEKATVAKEDIKETTKANVSISVETTTSSSARASALLRVSSGFTLWTIK